MTSLPTDTDKYGGASPTLMVRAVHGSVRNLVRRRLEESGGDWEAFVFGSADTLITAADFAAVEEAVLRTGHRFAWSASVSVTERPDCYAGGGDGAAPDFSFEHPDAPTAPAGDDGREQRGLGDNVVQQQGNTRGVARYVRDTQQVMRFLTEGVPEGTVAIIDDSGGTLTAPVLEQFRAVICAGGTTRSHLGILTREYGIPCLMNARISGIRDGDLVEIESSAPAKTAEDYQAAREVTARVWRITPGGD